MFLRKVLGAVFVSLVFFMPVYLPQYAFAACCVCNQGQIQCGSPRGCNCSCGCGGAPATIQCLKSIDNEKGEVTFEDKETHQLTTMGFAEDVFKNMKVGDCGMVQAKRMEVLQCTKFATTTERTDPSQKP